MKHIIFDIDGTLLDNTYAVIHSLQDALWETQRKKYPEEELMFCLGITGENALIQLGCKDIKDTLKRWDEQLLRYNHTISLFQGIESCILELKKIGFQVGIVSSKTKSEFEAELGQMPLMRSFDIIVLADDTKKHKPDPEPLLMYLTKAQVYNEDVVYVGDSIYDMQCAKAANIIGYFALWGSQMKNCPLATQSFKTPEALTEHLKTLQ